MSADKVYRAIGLMSGTSLDGALDVALIETDGKSHVKPIKYLAYPYDRDVRDKVRACFGKTERDEDVIVAEDLVTDLHIQAVQSLGEQADIIGFHGQTITHNPGHHFTWQIGDGERLARETGIDVVYDMRQADVKAGGQGAPLLPLYHQALLAEQELPLAVLNIGGVSNITYIGGDGQLIAFDCGPGNALMDDFIKERNGADYDEGGRLASQTLPLENIVKDFLTDEYFLRLPPKSLDRDHWSIDCVRYASTEEGMATLSAMTVAGIKAAIDHLPARPAHIYVAGGGRKNTFLIDSIQERLGIEISSINTLGWNGDAIEAEGFAYLAVRSLLGLPLTLPGTTGVEKEMTGGVLVAA